MQQKNEGGMSDDNVKSLDDARMAKALGLSLGSVVVADTADGDEWTGFPLAVPAGLTRAMAGLGLEKPTDWPYSLSRGQPCFTLGEGCLMLGGALAAFKAAAMELEGDGREGADRVRQLVLTWAPQLEALMEAMHASGMQTYKLAKAERENESARRFRMEQP
jgi:hypothetical protein